MTTVKKNNETDRVLRHGPIVRADVEPLSVRLWRQATAGATRCDDDVARPDVEVLLGDGSVLRLHKCLLARVSPYFEAALRFRANNAMESGPEVATIDCRDSDVTITRFLIKEAYCGTAPVDYECSVDQYVTTVRTYKRYLVPVPQNVHIVKMPRRFKIGSYPGLLHAQDPVCTYRLRCPDEMAAAVRDINAVIGVPVVRSLSWRWCNYYAPNSEADYNDLVVTMNGIDYNTGRHYTSSPATVSIDRAIEYIIACCLDEDADVEEAKDAGDDSGKGDNRDQKTGE
ncbi:BTB incomplete domain containing protein [Pandoravirus salinus]|uniref:BTB incomplete domain containing protein n=1 Tax=Pandoravirus salinus TaxID=1349410 RepID=S4VTE3_9VIRU|nr:BTB incomplete domain [Pandoravirus salinus]AGO83568.1 BTB incomplete domain containing protein [Pandoravirus salinus]